MTTTETMILRAAQSRPGTWLNCSGRYIGEVLALQLKGVIEQRVIDGQLRVKLKDGEQ